MGLWVLAPFCAFFFPAIFFSVHHFGFFTENAPDHAHTDRFLPFFPPKKLCPRPFPRTDRRPRINTRLVGKSSMDHERGNPGPAVSAHFSNATGHGKTRSSERRRCNPRQDVKHTTRPWHVRGKRMPRSASIPRRFPRATSHLGIGGRNEMTGCDHARLSVGKTTKWKVGIP